MATCIQISRDGLNFSGTKMKSDLIFTAQEGGSKELEEDENKRERYLRPHSLFMRPITIKSQRDMNIWLES